MALFVGYSSLQLMQPQVPPKGNRLTVASTPIPPPVQAAEPPAAPQPPVFAPEPVAAGPAPVETAPPQAVVGKPLPRPKAKRRVRHRAIAKPKDTCVGPLCALLASK